ncbi:MAG: ABC transporter permease [Phycisphaeraceae bacterium]
MRKYLNILRIFWSASVSAEMEYRANFMMATFSSIVTLAGTVLMLFLFYRTGYEMGGWAWRDALAVVGAFTFLEGAQSSFMSPNRVRVTEHVREGTLDFVLLKPVDSQFWLSVRVLSLWGLPNMLLGVAILAFVALTRSPIPSLTDVLCTAWTLAMALAVLYSLGYLLSTISIWYVKLYNITMAMQALVETGRYPIPAYPPAYQAFFTFVLPVAFMTTVPARFLTGQGSADWMLSATIVAVGLLLLSIAFWRFALRYYTSASS